MPSSRRGPEAASGAGPPNRAGLVDLYAEAAARASGSWSRKALEKAAWAALRHAADAAADAAFVSGAYAALSASEDDDDGEPPSLAAGPEFGADGARNMTEFVAAKGLPINCFVRNGILLSAHFFFGYSSLLRGDLLTTR